MARLSLQLKGNRWYVYAGGALEPVLHVHCVTGGLVAPAAEAISDQLVIDVVDLLANRGQIVLSHRARLWWDRNRPPARPGR